MPATHLPDRRSGTEGLGRQPHATYVVGIGASAGGIEPLETFFSGMPDDSGAAFVIVQHLAAHFDSLMDEILARRTGMTIRKVEDVLPIEANTIYLLAQGKNVLIQDGFLRAIDPPTDSFPIYPIDRFFQSLAREWGAKAIAIVLSGTGTDGNRGIEAVHQEGGTILVQDPKSAQFDGMPIQAISTNCVDLVLPPDRLASTVYQLVTGGSIQILEGSGVELPDDFLDRCIELLALDREELDMAQYRPATLSRRLFRRMRVTGQNDPNAYLELLSASEEERQAVRQDMMIAVTAFFRDPNYWERLRETAILPLLEERSTDEEIRVWTTACATGEEAYSIVIMFLAEAERLGRSIRLKVFASDVDATSLAISSKGLFSAKATEAMPLEYRDKYFVAEGDSYRIRRSVRDLIIFFEHNLAADPPLTRMHLVTCRNILIYLKPVVQKKALSGLHAALQKGGVLFLGPSESLGDLRQEFDTLDSSGRIFKKRRDVKLGDYFKLSVRGSHAAAPPVASRGRDTDAQVLRELVDMILPNFGHAAILTDELGHVLSIHGDGSRFLRFPSGDLDTHVTRLVRDEFSIPLKVALRRSSTTPETVDLPLIRLSDGNGSGEHAVRVSIRHRQDRKGIQRFLIVFRVDEATRSTTPSVQVPASVEDHLTELEEELKETRVLLTSAVEELSASNEEQQTTNEELLAANEELQSTNEELQSVNEELHTVNAEYQKKIQELSSLTHDLDSLLESSRIGTIFLDDDLCVRKFTDSATDIVSLRSSDVGRPIRQLSNELTSFDLYAHLVATREDRKPGQHEVQTLDGRWFLMRSHPYDVSGFGENGIVLTFVDITRMKESEEALRHSEERFGLVIEGSQDGIWDWDPIADTAFVSRRWLRIHGLPPETTETVTREVWSSCIHREDRPTMEQRLAAHLETDVLYDHEYRTVHPDGSIHWVRNRGKCIRDEHGRALRVCGTTTDISAVKAAETQLRSAYESVSKSNRELDDLTYIASHDLKEPLRGINSLSQILLEDHADRLNEDGQGRLKRLQVLTTRLERLIDGLLHYSKLGRIEANTEDVSLSALVGEIAETTRLSTEGAHITVHPLPNVVCDSVRVGEVFRNLISNGIKYNESDVPQVEIGVESPDRLPPGSPEIRPETTVFYVRDNGIGIDGKHAESVFQMFRRLHPRDAFGGGTGAGLAIAKRIIELHGGTVWLHSTPGSGSTFYFTLE
ncbi:MAG: chemotaxis protein CheB [Candidatus Eisenbacteria bacterium]